MPRAREKVSAVRPGSRSRRRARKAGGAASSEKARATAAPVRLERVLVPIDFSEASLKALRFARWFAKSFGAALRLVHVVEPGSFLNAIPGTGRETEDREAANRVHHKLVMLARREFPASVPVKPLVCVGKPFYEIVRVAQTFDVDLIIIATQGRTGVREALLGSTAERVVRHAPCPVLVVREREGGLTPAAAVPPGKEP